MNKDSVYEDIDIAKQLIEDKTNNYFLLNFSDRSSIYRFSNENIDSYKKYLKNREKILTITASGDQILSSIMLGTEEIDSIDISRFPKYYFELKKAAIMTLSLEEYIRFFVPEIEEEQEHINDIDERYKNTGMHKELALKYFFRNAMLNLKGEKDLSEMYYALNSNLSSENKIFWDELVKLYNPLTLYQSKLFRQADIKAVYQIITGNYCNAIYLKDEDTYNDLKSKIASCTVNHHIGNIFQEIDTFNNPYDLVNLSNIIDYSGFSEYRQLLDKFNLTEDGIILSYIYCSNIDDRVKYEFRDKRKYKFKKLPTENIMIYKK